MSRQHNTPYYELVEASKRYLGPAGERFVRRQIYMHLDKEPEKIQRHEINDLIKWIRPAFALITNNKDYLNAYISKLEHLAAKSGSEHNNHKNNVKLTSG